MGMNTKIDWCDATWNPVTGCLNGCEYCYARRIAERFRGGCGFSARGEIVIGGRMWEVDDPGERGNGQKAVYPFGFDPTFHRYKLDEPQKWKKPRTIFVCSMADLFGSWVPDIVIKEVFDACAKAPQHRYMFLTKHPRRYIDLSRKNLLPSDVDMWFGSTVTKPEDEFFFDRTRNTFISIEPIMAPFKEIGMDADKTNLIIIGAETGNRKGKIIPEKEWIDELITMVDHNHVAIFMKESMRGLMGSDFRQELPWVHP